MVQDHEVIQSIMAQGANGFVSKSAKPEDMSSAFLNVMDGETVTLLSSGPDITVPENEVIASLTPRQIEVLRHLAHGRSNKEIARELGISPYTVRIHVSALFKTLSLSSRSAAAAFASARGIV